MESVLYKGEIIRLIVCNFVGRSSFWDGTGADSVRYGLNVLSVWDFAFVFRVGRGWMGVSKTEVAIR